MAMQFHLKVVTPDRIFFEGDVDQLIVRGVEGDFAVLPNMSPFVTRVDIHRMKIFTDGKERIAAVHGGYIDIRDDNVILVANACEWPEEIDIERAKLAKERAEKRLKDQSAYDTMRAEISLKKAINRINLKK
ncbi:MAG: ATP synthase F1 subunit epsilon [Tissierellia bacterium]|nr:ATP synthase F1 subunit epsilon [Tissierellia bacterium]